MRDSLRKNENSIAASGAAVVPLFQENAQRRVVVYHNRSQLNALPRVMRVFSPAGVVMREVSMPFGAETVSTIAQLAPLMIGSFAIALSVGAFGVSVVDERQRGLKQALHMAGVSRATYWLSHFLADVAAQVAVMILCVTLLAVSRGLAGVSPFAMALLLLGYAPSAILMAYCVSFLFSDAETAQKWFPAAINGLLLLSFPLLVSVLLALSYSWVWLIVYLFAALLPFFALFAGFIALVLGQHGPFVGVLAALGAGVALWSAVLLRWDRRKSRPLKTTKRSENTPTWLRANALEADDVRAERELIEEVLDERGERKREYAVLMRDVKRRFKGALSGGVPRPWMANQGVKEASDVVAVRGVTMGVKRGECFGLLGENGAGKSTILGLLSGTIEPNHGLMLVDGHKTPKHRERVYRSIGVCPQFDCLYEQLTPAEHMQVFGVIRGLSDAQLARHRRDVCAELGLDDALFERRVHALSGGTKRKVSLALALLGEPRLVWLDEPTTGMDPSARRATWQVISNLRSANRTFILTTHNMEEADALCSRIGILADGRLRAIGSTARLKETHGRGLRVDVTASREHIDSIDQFIREQFENCEPLNEFGKTRHYQVHDEPIGRIFSTIETHKQTLNILDYCVSETTLEQVFLTVISRVWREREEENNDDDDDDDNDED